MVKIYIYLKKEIEVENEEGLEELKKVLEMYYKNKLFDEIFIIKDRDIEELEKFKDLYLYSAIRDLRYLKEENQILKNLFRKILKLVHELKDAVLLKR